MAGQADGSIIVNTEIDESGFAADSKKIQGAIKSLNGKMASLGSTFQRALTGNASALSAFDMKAETLEETITNLEAEMEALGEKRVPTEDYQWLTTEIEKAEKELVKLEERQAKMEDTGVKQSSSAWKSLQYDIDLAKRKIEDYKNDQAYMRDSGTAFQMGTNTAEYAQLESALSAAKMRLEELRNAEDQVKEAQPFNELLSDINNADVNAEKLESTFARLKTTNVSQNSSQWGNLAFSIQTARNQLDGYESTLQQLHSAGTINDEQFQQASTAIASARERMSELAKETDKARGKMGFFAKIGAGVKSAVSHIGNAVTKMKAFKKESKGCGSAISKLGKKITGLGSMLKRMVLRKIMMAMITAVKEGFNNLAQYSAQTNKDLSALKSSLTRLKNSFATAFAPILSVVTPILTKLIDYLSTAITYVGKFFAAFTGAKTFTKAKAVQEDYAASLNNTSKAAKNAQKQLAGIDELTVLGDKSSDDNDSGSVDPSEMFEEVPIESHITDFVGKIKEAFKNGDFASIGEVIGTKINSAVQKINDFIRWDNVGDKITKGITGVASGFNSLIKTTDFKLIGETLGEGLNTGLNTLYLVITEFDWPGLAAQLANGLNGLVSKFDWGKLGTTLSTGARRALATLRSAITTFDWASLGKGVADGINNIDWVGILSDLAGGISDIVKAALDLLIGFAENLDWGKLGSDLWNGLIGIITNIDWGGIISKAFELLGMAVAGAAKLIIGFAKSLWESLKSAFESTKNYFSKYIDEAGGNVILGLLNGIWNGIKNIGVWIKEHIFDPFINGFKKVFGIHSPSTVMAEMGGFLIEGLLNGIKAIWSGITSFFSNALSGLSSLISNAWSGIKSVASSAWSGIKNTISSAWSGIKSGVSNACSAVGSAVSSAWSNVKNHISTNLNNAKTAASNAWNSIKSTASTIGSNIASTVSSAWTSVKNHISNNLNNAKTAASNAWNSIKSTASTVSSNIKSTVSSAWDSLKSTMSSKLSSIKDSVSSTFSTLKNSASTWGKDLCSNMANGIKNAASAIGDAVSGVASKIKSFLGFSEPEDGPLSNFHTYMPDMIDLMTYGIKKNQGKALGAVSDMAAAISSEIQNGDYALDGFGMNEGLNSSLDNFSSKITNGFTDLLDRLQTIANGVTFNAPIVAQGLTPYSVSAAVGASDNKLHNDDSADVVELLTAMMTGFEAVVKAIQDKDSTVSIGDDDIGKAAARWQKKQAMMQGG